jgi:UDP-N-acetylglucosamine 4,6-dehydratase/5-epimerase
MFDKKTLLITGGTGSFGNAVLDRFLKSEIDEIRIFSRDEKKQEDMRIKYADPKLKFYIGDVRDFSSITNAMNGVDYVFHAAALKQVPSCEFFPMEAIRTNAIGAENVMTASLENGVKKAVVLSTDKAVYPINAMGISKAMMEKLMVSKSRNRKDSDTVFCATRYGNVMASRGSVIPLFVSQAKLGKDITVTDSNMTRYLMSLDESVELVLHAFKKSIQGDIFVQMAPACTVGDLANAIIEMFGSSSTIKSIGTRHGEKLFETLVSREEMAKANEEGGYYCIPADKRELNYSAYFSCGDSKIDELDDYTSHNTVRLTTEEIKSTLLKLPFIKEQLND